MNLSTLSSSLKANHDPRLIRIAHDLSDTANVDVPRLLLQLKEIFKSHLPGSVGRSQLKQDVWSYDILHVITLVIRGDFSKIRDGWGIAVQLCEIASLCVSGFTPSEQEEYYGFTLPRLVENQLMLSRRLQNQYIKTPLLSTRKKDELLGYLRGSLDYLCDVLSSHPALCETALASPWLLHVLITDDLESSLAALSLISSVLNLDRHVLEKMQYDSILALMDEVAYKIISTTKAKIAGGSMKCIIALCRALDSLVPELCGRYRGLKQHVLRWQGRGLDKELRDMLKLLEAGTAQQAKLERLADAAIVIQAIWKSFATRRRLARAQHAVAKFQRSYRQRQRNKALEKEKQVERKSLEERLAAQRRRTIRDFRQKQMNTLHILPATEVERYFERQQHDAAVKIQSCYRGYRSRTQVTGLADVVHRRRAVVVLQRAVRRWLEKLRRARAEPPRFSLPPGLTDQRRDEIQEIIQDFKDEHPPVLGSRKDQEERYTHVQRLLANHFSGLRDTRRKMQSRDATMAMIQSDAQLLSDAPSLKDVTEDDLVHFRSFALPVATRAKLNHNETLRSLRMPWWKKLGQDDIEAPPEKEFHIL